MRAVRCNARADKWADKAGQMDNIEAFKKFTRAHERSAHEWSAHDGLLMRGQVEMPI